MPNQAWVQRAPGRPYFITEDGTPWTPIGQNDAISWADWRGLLHRQDLPAIGGHLRWLATHGVTVLRFMLEYAETGEHFFERPDGNFNPVLIQAWDDLFDLAGNAGLRVLLTPLDTYFHWVRWDLHPFNVANVGTGTARVIWFEIARDNTPMRSIFKLIDYQPRAADKDYITTTAVANTYLPAGEHRFIMSWPVPKSVESLSRWNALDATRSTLVASACFCSVLGECWTSHLRADLPQPVKQCDARGHRNFEG